MAPRSAALAALALCAPGSTSALDNGLAQTPCEPRTPPFACLDPGALTPA
eukprot:COSAG04_NODE_2577_length_3906_cov_2.580510_6_plen_50_part_00